MHSSVLSGALRSGLSTQWGEKRQPYIVHNDKACYTHQMLKAELERAYVCVCVFSFLCFFLLESIANAITFNLSPAAFSISLLYIHKQ